jgi:hypothetical protein
MSTQQLLTWALGLAERGWRVFPLVPGSKRPAIRAWEQRATTDPERITRCWNHAPYNIGLVTGPSGLVVVDLDTPDEGEAAPDGWSMVGISSGVDVLAHLATRAGASLPETYTVTTPSGGTHLYFRAPTTVDLRNTAGELGWLVDTRAHGGYVVAPGSITPRGGYELHDDSDPADLPGWLLQALTPKPREAISAPREIASVRHSAYVAGALQGEADRVLKARSGRHNKTLFEASVALGQLVGGGHLDHGEATRVLQHAAGYHVRSRCNCTERETTKTIESGLRAGVSRPRVLTHREGNAA